jgi:hypothetical protein
MRTESVPCVIYCDFESFLAPEVISQIKVQLTRTFPAAFVLSLFLFMMSLTMLQQNFIQETTLRLNFINIC